LSRIDANARHLLTLINEILDITRIEAGRMPIQVVPFNLSDLIKGIHQNNLHKEVLAGDRRGREAF